MYFVKLSAVKYSSRSILLCGHQDVALRGHIESNLSMNRDNFLEILKLVGNHDCCIRKIIIKWA